MKTIKYLSLIVITTLLFSCSTEPTNTDTDSETETDVETTIDVDVDIESTDTDTTSETLRYQDEIERKMTTVKSTNINITVASFPGGENEMIEYIQSNTDYPKEAKDMDKVGIVVVQFIVNKDGKISNIEIVESLNPYLDKAAMSLVSSMPEWNPAQENTHPVASMMRLPIKFELN